MKKLLVVVAVLGLVGVSLLAQSKPSIQGVWRPVEATVTNPNPAPGVIGKGTHTNLQPGLLIFTGKHYSQILDSGSKPRPTTGFKIAGKPTAEEMQAQWGPFVASAGTYEVTGSTLTTNGIVAKNPANQGRLVTRYTFKLDGKNLWTTQVENADGKIANTNTVKYVRVE